MRLETYRRGLGIAQSITLIGLGLVVVWNMVSLRFGWHSLAWGVDLLLPLSGVSGWLGILVAPTILAWLRPVAQQWYRLTYDAAADWKDDSARAALSNLARTEGGLEIIWAQTGEGLECWLAVPGNSVVLPRLIADVFPRGDLEEGQPPSIGSGGVLLDLDGQPLPTPDLLVQMSGIDGVYVRWMSDQTAVVAVWGPSATSTTRQYVAHEGLLPGRGDELRRARFISPNPWPFFPSFPSTQGQPGLAARSSLTLTAPALRIKGDEPALVLGLDPDQQLVGFVRPELMGLHPLQIFGQAAETVALQLVEQAIQARQPVLWLDGRGMATGQLTRRFVRELATGQMLLCDVERPAQSQFRLNPLWLPTSSQHWPDIFAGGWMAWLRDLGVTPGGLGQEAYRHTLAAVMLTGWLGAQQGLALDVTGLEEALAAPDFLPMIDLNVSTDEWLPADLWHWWLNSGRHTPDFDVHVRLGHLRGRLKGLLDIPEYQVLWQSPYLNLTNHLAQGHCLCWRLPDSRQRLGPYISSQLLALHTLLAVWPADQPPLLIFLHELDIGQWLTRLNAHPAARLIVSTAAVPRRIFSDDGATLLLSRLSGVDARRLQAELPGVRATDLSRLPSGRLVMKQGEIVGTVDLSEV